MASFADEPIEEKGRRGTKLGRLIGRTTGSGRSGGGGIRRTIRGASEPFDPHPIDGDNDGIVQEGTAWERPAVARTPSLPKKPSRTRMQRAEEARAETRIGDRGDIIVPMASRMQSGGGTGRGRLELADVALRSVDAPKTPKADKPTMASATRLLTNEGEHKFIEKLLKAKVDFTKDSDREKLRRASRMAIKGMDDNQLTDVLTNIENELKKDHRPDFKDRLRLIRDGIKQAINDREDYLKRAAAKKESAQSELQRLHERFPKLPTLIKRADGVVERRATGKTLKEISENLDLYNARQLELEDIRNAAEEELDNAKTELLQLQSELDQLEEELTLYPDRYSKKAQAVIKDISDRRKQITELRTRQQVAQDNFSRAQEEIGEIRKVKGEMYREFADNMGINQYIQQQVQSPKYKGQIDRIWEPADLIGGISDRIQMNFMNENPEGDLRRLKDGTVSRSNLHKKLDELGDVLNRRDEMVKSGRMHNGLKSLIAANIRDGVSNFGARGDTQKEGRKRAQALEKELLERHAFLSRLQQSYETGGAKSVRSMMQRIQENARRSDLDPYGSERLKYLAQLAEYRYLFGGIGEDFTDNHARKLSRVLDGEPGSTGGGLTGTLRAMEFIRLSEQRRSAQIALAKAQNPIGRVTRRRRGDTPPEVVASKPNPVLVKRRQKSLDRINKELEDKFGGYSLDDVYTAVASLEPSPIRYGDVTGGDLGPATGRPMAAVDRSAELGPLLTYLRSLDPESWQIRDIRPKGRGKEGVEAVTDVMEARDNAVEQAVSTLADLRESSRDIANAGDSPTKEESYIEEAIQSLLNDDPNSPVGEAIADISSRGPLERAVINTLTGKQPEVVLDQNGKPVMPKGSRYVSRPTVDDSGRVTIRFTKPGSNVVQTRTFIPKGAGWQSTAKTKTELIAQLMDIAEKQNIPNFTEATAQQMISDLSSELSHRLAAFAPFEISEGISDNKGKVRVPAGARIIGNPVIDGNKVTIEYLLPPFGVFREGRPKKPTKVTFTVGGIGKKAANTLALVLIKSALDRWTTTTQEQAMDEIQFKASPTEIPLNPSNAVPDILPQERVTGDILRGYGPRRGNLERLLRYWRPIMRKEGGFRRCRVILADHPELYPLEPLCAWLHHETTGLWPNEGCHHPGMKNCRRKLKRVVRGSLFSDSEFNDRLQRLTSGKLNVRVPGGKLPNVPGKSAEYDMAESDYAVHSAQPNMTPDLSDEDLAALSEKGLLDLGIMALKAFMVNEPEWVEHLRDDDNWEHIGEDDEGYAVPHMMVIPPGGHGGGCGCGGSCGCGGACGGGMKSAESVIDALDDLSGIIVGGIEAKAGRALSARNISRVRQAVQALQDILREVDGGMAVKGDSAIIAADPDELFSLKQFLDPVFDHHNVSVEVVEDGILIKDASHLSNATLEAIALGLDNFDHSELIF